MVKVLLMCEDGTKPFHIEMDMLFKLMINIDENGEETIHTQERSYVVKGVLFGKTSGHVIIT